MGVAAMAALTSWSTNSAYPARLGLVAGAESRSDLDRHSQLERGDRFFDAGFQGAAVGAQFGRSRRHRPEPSGSGCGADR